MRMRAGRLVRGVILFAIALALALSPLYLHRPAAAQISLSGGSNSAQAVVNWVYLDGYKVFQVAAPQAAVGSRVRRVEKNFKQIRDEYLQADSPDIRFTTEPMGRDDLPAIFINSSYLFTLTEADARMQGTLPWSLVEDLQQSIPNALRQARQQRQPEYLRRQGMTASAISLAAAVMVAIIEYGQRQSPGRYGLVGWLLRISPRELDDRQREHLREAQQRSLQLLQLLIIAGASLLILWLFPMTRPFCLKAINGLKIPFVILVLLIVAYVGARLSFAFIENLSSGLVNESLSAIQNSRRTELRVSTITSVLKNVATFVWIVIGLLVALALVGINLGLLIASFSVIGLALSLIFRNLVTGAVNSFFIILEDQYAIGDVIALEDVAGGLSGLVENLNLRITQLRDASGRLITVPMSQISAVANFSHEWARADLKIPIPYHSDVNKALEIVRSTAEEMYRDAEWQSLILEPVEVLGIEDFGDRGPVVRVWIKTQPIKQWDVSREFHRRLKLAFDAAEITVPAQQQEIWVRPATDMQFQLDGLTDNSDSNGDSRGQETATIGATPEAGKQDSQDEGEIAAEAAEGD